MKMIKNLKKLRNDIGISQQQLAEIVMVSQQSINKYENHGVEPDIDTLIRIADYFNVSLDYLAGRTDIKETVTKLNTSDLNDKEVKIVKKFRSLNKKQQQFVETLVDSY